MDMSMYLKINSIIVILILFGCAKLKWIADCPEPYIELTEIINNKNYLLTKYNRIELTRAKRWQRDSELAYIFRDFDNCRVIIRFKGEWKHIEDEASSACNYLFPKVLECRKICDSLQILDLRIYKTETRTSFLFGYKLDCVILPDSIRYKINGNNNYIYLVDSENKTCFSEYMSPCSTSFIYNQEQFCICQY